VQSAAELPYVPCDEDVDEIFCDSSSSDECEKSDPVKVMKRLTVDLEQAFIDPELNAKKHTDARMKTLLLNPIIVDGDSSDDSSSSEVLKSDDSIDCLSGHHFIKHPRSP
jgi:hypothetical protein